MSKAIAGAAMIAADLAIGATLALNPELLALLPAGMAGINLLNGVIMGLFLGGVSMEAGALANALTSNRGENITVRMAAGLRQIIYGMQRVGGNVIYQSTTGAGGASGNYVYNYIITIASHEIDAFINIYLDGRQVFFRQDGNAANMGCGSVAHPFTCTASIAAGAVTGVAVSGSGSGFSRIKAARYRVRIWGGGGSGAAAYATNSGTGSSPIFAVVMTAGGSGYTSAPHAEIQGAYVFGGVAAADDQDPTHVGYGSGYGIGPSGQHYNFSRKVFCEARFGDQIASDSMTSLTANDPTWPPTANVGGCAYLYLNVGYDTQLFQNPPEIRVTVTGKNSIYDPRSGLTGFSTNWALQVADVLTDPVWGLGDGGAVNTAQLVAAANVCDELVPTSQGSETRYAQHVHYDSSTGPGDALQMMMPAAAGRLGRIGGEWWIWPAYWQGPSFSFDQSTLIDTPTWTPYRSFKDLFNRVNGTYVAPNYPYNVAGNLYDANGWYYGVRDNLWPFAWQPTNYPQYAADPLHGYAADEYLAEDGGAILPRELALRGVISITQAQRIAKIALMRNRWQGSGSFAMGLEAWQVQPVDVIAFTWNIFGWAEKMLEVTEVHFVCEPVKGASGGEEDATLALSVQVMIQETDPTVYEWSLYEELTPYDVPAESRQIPTTPAAPTVFTVTSSAGTAIIGADGIVIPRARLQWNSPLDTSVTMIQMQYQEDGAVVDGQNVLFNGDFSQGATGWYFQPPWALGTGSLPGGGTGNVAVFPCPGSNAAVANNSEVVCLPGDVVSASCSSLGTTGASGNAVLRLYFYDSSGNLIGGDYDSNATPNNNTWTLNQVTATAPAGTDHAHCDFAVTGASGSGQWSMCDMVAFIVMPAWVEAGAVDVGLFVAFIQGVVAGQTYNFRIRSIRRAGVWSEWVEVDGEVISITLTNTVGIGYAVAPSGTLSAQAFADGTASIIVSDFPAVWGNLSAACTPVPNTLPGLQQSQLYYVYYQDPTFAGGIIAPVATQNTLDFADRVGYFLIGSIVTPSYTPYYAPTANHDLGASSSLTPNAAYDRNATTNAIIQAYLSATGTWVWHNSTGDCLFSGFPALVTSAAMTLTVTCSLTVLAGITGSGKIVAHIGSTNTTVATLTGNTAQADHTLGIPSGTDLSTMTVEAIASITAPPNGTSGTQGWAHLNVFEISIQ